jgi:SAM-dependent methyltransferase
VSKTNASTWLERYIDRFYRSQPGWINGTVEFHNLCRQLIKLGSLILEIGAGPSNPTTGFLATLGRVRGIDVDPDVGSNKFLAASDVISSSSSGYPYSDAVFDACVSNYVLEHVSDPRQHFREVYRVLKPGACYLFRTPNRYHYTAIGALLTPHAIHAEISNRLRSLPAGSHDPYKTHYRANSRRALTKLSREIGFQVEELRLIEKEPSYGKLARPLFLLGVAYERAVNATSSAAGLRANILGVMRRPAA